MEYFERIVDNDDQKEEWNSLMEKSIMMIRRRSEILWRRLFACGMTSILLRRLRRIGSDLKHQILETDSFD